MSKPRVASAGVPIPDGTVATGATKVSLWCKGTHSNIALLNAGPTWSSFNKRIITSPCLLGGGSRRNAQIIINFRTHDTDPSKRVWWGVEWDYDSSKLRIVYHNGTTKSTLTSLTIPPIGTLTWVLLTAEIYDDVNDENYGWIKGIIETGGPRYQVGSLGPYRVNFGATDGLPGVGSHLSETVFSFLKIENR